ncbi:MAG: carboxy terminal-processing peptidase [Pirellulales bacterium]|nr:carboxy terminal-processing peptidase [Pirellulales bacterium]
MIRRIVFSRVWWVGSLAAIVILGGTFSSGWADPIGPTANERYVVLAVTTLLDRDHLLQHPLDDEIAKRAFRVYLKLLDPMKVYFYQSDIDEFEKSITKLDDMIRHRDTSFGYKVFDRFLKRIDERVAMVDRILAMKHDFTVDEEMAVDRDVTQYPKTPEEAFERWRKRIKYDLLVLKAQEDEKDHFEGQAAIDKLSRRYHSFAKRMHQTDNEEVLETYLSSVTNSLDPHTAYMSPSTLENFNIAMKLELEGIGASLRSEDGIVVVHKLVPGGAAEKDGRLKVGDKIIGVGQNAKGEIVDVVDMSLNDVVKLIRGNQGTIVRLQVDPIDGGAVKVLDVTRAKIELKDSEAQSLVIEEGRKPNGKPYKIGVIDLPSFYMDMEGHRRGLPDYRSTTRDVRTILENFKKQDVDAVILDLRRNGGGSLNEAISLTGLFIDEGPVVQVKGPDGTVQPYYDLDSGMVWSGPLVVLTSKFSASASEILAGAIQDYRRGLIVGDQSTHGKGTVQSLMDLARQLAIFQMPYAPKLGAMKITIQQFYRPSGDSTQNRGVVADVELPSLTTYLEDIGEADLDYPIAFDRVSETFFSRLDYVSKPILDRLKDLSAKRCKSSEDFQKVERNIKRYQEQKERKYVTLNEKKFMAERAELNADKEEEREIEKMIDPDRPAIERTYYLDEALAITLDYIQMMNLARAH